MTDNFSGLSNSPNYGDLVKHVNLKYVLSEKMNNNLWRQTNHFKVHNYVSCWDQHNILLVLPYFDCVLKISNNFVKVNSQSQFDIIDTNFLFFFIAETEM